MHQLNPRKFHGNNCYDRKTSHSTSCKGWQIILKHKHKIRGSNELNCNFEILNTPSINLLLALTAGLLFLSIAASIATIQCCYSRFALESSKLGTDSWVSWAVLVDQT